MSIIASITSISRVNSNKIVGKATTTTTPSATGRIQFDNNQIQERRLVSGLLCDLGMTVEHIGL